MEAVKFCGKTIDTDEMIVSCFDKTLSDIAQLKAVKKLKQLSLRGTRVSDIKSLTELKNLEWLDLSSTAVKDITPLKSLKKLKYLDLYQTRVSKYQGKELKRALPECKVLGPTFFKPSCTPAIQAKSGSPVQIKIFIKDRLAVGWGPAYPCYASTIECPLPIRGTLYIGTNKMLSYAMQANDRHLLFLKPGSPEDAINGAFKAHDPASGTWTWWKVLSYEPENYGTF
jgi:hypothetical protein